MAKTALAPDQTDWLIKPMRFKNLDLWKEFKIDIEWLCSKVIASDRRLQLSFIDAEFAGIQLTNSIPTACIGQNQKTRRYELLLNPSFVKACFMQSQVERVKATRRTDLAQFAQSFSSIQPLEIEFTSKADVEKKILDTAKILLLHEFGHLWFHHLYTHPDLAEEDQFLVNLIMDGFINFNLNCQDLHNPVWREYKNMFIGLLPFVAPSLAPDYSILAGFKDTQKYEQLWRVIDPNDLLLYKSLRVWQSQKIHFRPLKFENLAKGVDRIVKDLKSYGDTIYNLVQKVKELLPEKTQQVLKIILTRGPITAGGNTYLPIEQTKLPPGLEESIKNTLLPGLGIGNGEILEKLTTEISDRIIEKSLIRRLVAYAEADPFSTIKKHIEIRSYRDISTLSFTPSKHYIPLEMVKSNNLVGNLLPPRFNPETTLYDKIREKRLNIYVDVSGSTDWCRPDMFALIKKLDKVAKLELFQFSTKVEPFPMEEFKEGIYNSTGGTDGNCVAEHIKDRTRDCKNFMVFGDREYGSLTQIIAEQNITIVDLYYGGRASHAPWFKPSKQIKVVSINLDKDFKGVSEQVYK